MQLLQPSREQALRAYAEVEETDTEFAQLERELVEMYNSSGDVFAAHSETLGRFVDDVGRFDYERLMRDIMFDPEQVRDGGTHGSRRRRRRRRGSINYWVRLL